jgi:hypothetical protein
MGLLAALVATNVAFALLQRTGGPLIGMLFYGAMLVLARRGRQRDHRAVTVGGLVGLAVHLVEVTALGWAAYPVLVALSLVLPGALALAALVASRGPQHVAGGA